MDGLLRENERTRVPDDALGDAIGLAVSHAIADAAADRDTCPFCHPDTFTDDDPAAITAY